MAILLFISRLAPFVFSIKKLNKSLATEKEEPKNKKIAIVQEGLNIYSVGEWTLCKWEELTLCYFNAKYIYVQFDNGKFFLIPKKVFVIAEDLLNFEQIMKFEAAKISSPKKFPKGKFIKNSHKKWIVTFCILLLMFKGCITSNIKFFNEQNLPDEHIAIEKKSAREKCLNLFTKETQLRLNQFSLPSDIRISKSQHAFCKMNYGTNELIIHEVNIPNNSSLQKVVQFENGKNHFGLTGVGTGWGDGTSSYEILFSFEHDSLANEIIVDYDGSLLNKKVFGDSIINYTLIATKLSFRYERDGDANLTFESKRPNIYEPMPRKIRTNVAFYKKGTSVFVIIMSNYSKHAVVDSLTLPNLLGVKSSN